MQRFIFIFGLCFLLIQCTEPTTQSTLENTDTTPTISPDQQLTLTLEHANQLSELPFRCVDVEYPNKLNQVIGGDDDLQSPKALHPAFYGCFDWHSAVHGHWSLVKLLKTHPTLHRADSIKTQLLQHISAENIQEEIRYFDDPNSQGFERMYGWAWLLKLAEEIHTWEDPIANELETNLQPLTEVIVERCIQFLPKLNYPIRVGTHTNTAFALSMVFDYAKTTQATQLLELVKQRATDFYLSDTNCPLSWEPSGYDFLSPCLEEANLMRRVLDPESYLEWLHKFLPELNQTSFELSPGIVSDRTDGHLVHLDGLNFSRAWCLFGIAKDFPTEYGHLITIGNNHIQHSLPELVGDSYEGGHWLGSFALLSLSQE